MKKLLVTTWMAALTALVGCQQNDEFLTNPEAPTTGGKQITVSAQIKGNKGDARVALTETQDKNQNPTVKVEWRKDANNPETFTLYQMEVPATTSDETSNDGGAAGGDAGSGDGGASVAVPITFTQAALGCEIEVPLLDGTKTPQKIDAGTQSGTVLNLKGKGVPYLNSKGKGNLYVRIVVETPKNLNSRQKELLKEFDAIENKRTYEKKSSFADKVKKFLGTD